ncbi:MAG: metal-sensitive transcriptional regulator [Acidibacillus sp.]|nr:metal-sensitive transcriptional regulator [Sulfoacidibacillus ferrooxidans]MCY0892887.1 metal-sensitive transcriptional regulator [Acidibacillus sp.]
MEYPADIKNRLRRIEGQVRGVLGMMESERGCQDVITQLTAVRTAVDRVLMYIVGANMERCIRQEMDEGAPADEVIRLAIEALMRSR